MTTRSSERPLVAIVTPVYNGEKYLAETMECVQAITYPNLVHVILDNASTDATPEIIKKYAAGRVPILTGRNAATIPMTENFNAVLGLIPPQAAYFRLLCADDLMTPDSISKQVDVAERDPEIRLVGCLCLAPTPRGWELDKSIEIFDGKEIVRNFLQKKHTALYGTEILFRHLQNQHTPFYDNALEGAIDADANMRVCQDGKFGFVHEILGSWRQHEQSHFTRFSELNLHMPEWLILLDRYGPAIMDARDYRRSRAAYRNHYLRRLLLLRYKHGDKATYAKHMDILRRWKDEPGLIDFSKALAEWAQLVVTRRRHMVGVARD